MKPKLLALWTLLAFITMQSATCNEKLVHEPNSLQPPPLIIRYEIIYRPVSTYKSNVVLYTDDNQRHELPMKIEQLIPTLLLLKEKGIRYNSETGNFVINQTQPHA